jgi:hypothetical protein
MSDTIYTLDGRENVFLEVMQSRFNLDESSMHDEINKAFQDCILVLDEMKIKYEDLKNGLIPSSNKKEIAFVFDTNQMEANYGFQVFSILIPLLDKKSCNSVLFGDFLGSEEWRVMLRAEFFRHIQKVREIDYQYHDQFCVIYINNLSNQSASAINEGLKQFVPYVGYFDLTYSSALKTYLSTILIRLFLKNKATIITQNEFSEDINVLGYPFEKSGFKCKGIESIYYGLFLSYKIEREVFGGFESDTSYSINAISKNVSNISDFNLQIEEPKLKYLLTAKADNMNRAGVTNLTLAEIERLIKNKIKDNYIYNLCFLKNSETLKFNIIIETARADTNKPMKLIVALEYIPLKKILRLITMF